MTADDLSRHYTPQVFRQEAEPLLRVVRNVRSVDSARERLSRRVASIYHDTFRDDPAPPARQLIRLRDCHIALASVLSHRSDARAGFSVAQAVWDIARGRHRPDLTPAFYAELIHWLRGLKGTSRYTQVGPPPRAHDYHGREAARIRSDELDKLWEAVDAKLKRFPDGLSEEAQARRAKRRRHILGVLGGTEADWWDWRWQVRNHVTDGDLLAKLIPLSDEERETIRRARAGHLPFGVTPHYASLMDEEDAGRDRAVRAQVLPPASYVDRMLEHRGQREHSFDFMLETDTSPIDLVTRRYPAVVILKPFNTCPQICVYCQRNWEIQEAMAAGAAASRSQIDAALAWIAAHPAIREVLVTGGDPLMLSDRRLDEIFAGLARIDHVDLIRVGTRVPVTVPMRITDELAAVLAKHRKLGQRDVAVVTHVEHVYELTPETVAAVERLRRQGIAVYNQHVYTFYVSRRFEAANLRMTLRRIGIDPYYTFAPKGKEETAPYLLPLSRILQEQKEEARLIPGLRRTDEAVFNVPGLGKNYLRAIQHRDLLTVRPDGARVYEFHPWEKNVVPQLTYLATDRPILDYLQRLADIGEDPEDYQSIWYYF